MQFEGDPEKRTAGFGLNEEMFFERKIKLKAIKFSTPKFCVQWYISV